MTTKSFDLAQSIEQVDRYRARNFIENAIDEDKPFVFTRKNPSKTFAGGIMIGIATGIAIGTLVTLTYILGMISV